MTAPRSARPEIGEAIESVAEGLPDDDAVLVAELVWQGLEAMDTTAPDDWLADNEIAPAAELPPSERVAWARAFAAKPVIDQLNSRAWRLAGALLDGDHDTDQLAAEAEDVRAGLEAIRIEELPDHLVRARNEGIADANWVVGRGEGPASLRVGRAKQRRG